MSKGIILVSLSTKGKLHYSSLLQSYRWAPLECCHIKAAWVKPWFSFQAEDRVKCSGVFREIGDVIWCFATKISSNYSRWEAMVVSWVESNMMFIKKVHSTFIKLIGQEIILSCSCLLEPYHSTHLSFCPSLTKSKTNWDLFTPSSKK